MKDVIKRILFSLLTDYILSKLPFSVHLIQNGNGSEFEPPIPLAYFG